MHESILAHENTPLWAPGLLLLVALVVAGDARGEPQPDDLLFCGGMLVNVTPLVVSHTEDRAVGLGLGGRFHLNVARHLRIGLMGLGSSGGYGPMDSEIGTGLGGVTVQGRLPVGPLDLALGVLVGGERATVHHYLSENDDGSFVVQRLDASGFMLSPHLDVELTFVRRLKLALTIQFRHATWLDDLYEPTVTFHLGILFNSYRAG